MQFFLDFIDWITNFFTSIWDFFTGFLDKMLIFFDYIGYAATLCYEFVASFPVWLQAFGILTIVISILFMVLGRDTGGKKE